MSLTPFGMDVVEVQNLLTMLDWMKRALNSRGATFTGDEGVGLGQADMVIEVKGMRYNVSIRPLGPAED